MDSSNDSHGPRHSRTLSIVTRLDTSLDHSQKRTGENPQNPGRCRARSGRARPRRSGRPAGETRRTYNLSLQSARSFPSSPLAQTYASRLRNTKGAASRASRSGCAPSAPTRTRLHTETFLIKGQCPTQPTLSVAVDALGRGLRGERLERVARKYPNCIQKNPQTASKNFSTPKKRGSASSRCGWSGRRRPRRARGTRGGMRPSECSPGDRGG